MLKMRSICWPTKSDAENKSFKFDSRGSFCNPHLLSESPWVRAINDSCNTPVFPSPPFLTHHDLILLMHPVLTTLSLSRGTLCFLLCGSLDGEALLGRWQHTDNPILPVGYILPKQQCLQGLNRRIALIPLCSVWRTRGSWFDFMLFGV